MAGSKKRILFLCTGNSCRSQMAEAWCRSLWGDRYECHSAGTEKHGMNELAVRVMRECGVDLSGQWSKTTGDLPAIHFDFVVTVCDSAREACPYFPGGKNVHVGFRDPPQLARSLSGEDEILRVYREVRDEIHRAIERLPVLLGEDS